MRYCMPSPLNSRITLVNVKLSLYLSVKYSKATSCIFSFKLVFIFFDKNIATIKTNNILNNIIIYYL